jgi:hypothetical protein
MQLKVRNVQAHLIPGMFAIINRLLGPLESRIDKERDAEGRHTLVTGPVHRCLCQHARFHALYVCPAQLQMC